jgi:hypothetical protein
MDQPKHDYLVISRGQWDERASREDVQRAIDQFYVWYEAHVAAGRMKPGSRLAPTGKVVAHHLTTDGPFVETKEVVGGYWFIVASSLEEAAELARHNPCLPFGLTLELRPLDPERARAADVTNETPPEWRRG